MLEKCQKYWFFDIFWDILDEMKGNLGNDYVKGGLLSFQDKIGTITPNFPEEMTVFPVLDLLFHLSLHKILHFHPHKNYMFEMRNNRAIF